MRLNTRIDRPPSKEVCCSIFQQSNAVNGLYLDYDKMNEYLFYYYQQADMYRKNFCKYTMQDESFPLKTAMQLFMPKVPVHKYLEKNKTGLSLSEPSIEAAVSMAKQTGELTKEVEFVIKVFSYASKCTATVSQFKEILLNNAIVAGKLSFDGHRMLRINPIWETQNTGRFAPTKPAPHNFSREVQDVWTVPQGYLPHHLDSGQIDPKVTFSTILPNPQIKKSIMHYNDAYYGLYFYSVMDSRLIKSKTLDLDFMEITDEMKVGRAGLKTIANAAVYGAAQDGGDPIKKAFIDRINALPEYKNWVSTTKQKILEGDYIAYTAFGNSMDSRRGSTLEGKFKDASDDARAKHTENAMRNAEIQGTSADLMRFSVKEEDNILTNGLYDSYMCMSVHDALYTAVNENEADELLPKLAGLGAYEVDDWIPITSDVEIGESYKNSVFNSRRY